MKNNRIKDTPTYLNMMQSLLFNEKKRISQRQEIQIIPKSYPFVQLTHWDAILCKQKYFFYNIKFFYSIF